MAKPILVLNGPNLNLLGTRQPDIYGTVTLDDIENMCVAHAKKHGHSIDFRQSNNEGEMVNWLHEARNSHCGVIINAGAYTHTSIALMDAIGSIETPAIEVHLSNIHAREEFRNFSYLSKVVIGQICGFGATGYRLAIDALSDHLK